MILVAHRRWTRASIAALLAAGVLLCFLDAKRSRAGVEVQGVCIESIMHPSMRYLCELSAAESWDEFLEAQCDWIDATDRMSVPYVFESDRGDEVAPSTMRERNVSAWWCGSMGWTAFRVGPFSTTGGYSWSSVLALINGTYLQSYRENVFAFSDFALGNIYDLPHEVKLVGYPPIHQHHFHFFGSGDANVQGMNNHGDSQCLPSQGGVRCLVRHAPRGFAYMLRSRLGVETEFNDVRAKNSPPLKSHVFLAFKLVPPTTTVRQISQSYIGFVDFSHTPALRYTYLVNTSEESFGWSTGALPEEATEFIEAYMHQHGDMLEDAWLCSGSAADVFFNTDVIGKPMRLHVNAGVIARMQANVRRSSIICRFKGNGQERQVFDGRYARFYRRSACYLPSGFRQWTFMVFHRRQPEEVVPLGEQYGVHALVRVYYAQKPGIAVLNRDLGLSEPDLVNRTSHHDSPWIAQFINIDGPKYIHPLR